MSKENDIFNREMCLLLNACVITDDLFSVYIYHLVMRSVHMECC